MRFRSLLVAAMVGAVSACGGDGGNGGAGPGDGPEGDVIVRNNNFTPSTLEVDAGATVVWAWQSSGTTHNVTFDDGEASGNRSSGTFSRTFTVAGAYPYHCTIHGPVMNGTVTVAAPAAINRGA